MYRLFKKREKNDNTLESLIENDINAYLSLNENVLFLSGIFEQKNMIEDKKSEYVDALNYFKTYMEQKFPDELLNGNNSLSIDESNMLAKAPTYVLELFAPVEYSDLIYINKPQQLAHMHTDGKNVLEVENVHALAGLDKSLQTEKINKIFDGMTVEEAAALLNQMQILDRENGELSRAIAINRNRIRIRELFFRDIIYNVLKEGTKESIVRARLFADSYGIAFDFNAFERNFIQVKELVKKNDC